MRFNLGDEVCVIAKGSRKGQVGIIKEVPQAISEVFQIYVVEFVSTAGKPKEHYFSKELEEL